MLAGINAARFLNGEALITLPPETMLGALTRYITDESHKDFQPINSNWGIIPPVQMPRKKDKKLKIQLAVARANEALQNYGQGGGQGRTTGTPDVG